MERRFRFAYRVVGSKSKSTIPASLTYAPKDGRSPSFSTCVRHMAPSLSSGKRHLAKYVAGPFFTGLMTHLSTPRNVEAMYLAPQFPGRSYPVQCLSRPTEHPDSCVEESPNGLYTAELLNGLGKLFSTPICMRSLSM